MEGRRDSGGADIPPNPLFSHPTSPETYMEELIHGLVTQNQPPAAEGQAGFQHWSACGSEADFMDWNVFRPTLDLSSATRAATSSGHVIDLPAGTSTTYSTCEDYLNSLNQPDTDKKLEQNSGGFFYPNTSPSHDSSGAGDSGRNLYAEAINNWMNFPGKPYEPFGQVFQPPTDSDLPVPEATCSSGTSSGGTSPIPACNSVKPSYSDVARNQPVSPLNQAATATTKTKTPSETLQCEFPDFSGFPKQDPLQWGSQGLPGRRHKVTSPSRPFSLRPNSPLSFDNPTTGPCNKNSSTMGLDQFGNAQRAKDRYKQQANCEDQSCTQSRKGSASSIGSASSGLEEVTYRTRTRTQSPCSNVNQEDGTTIGCEDSSSGTRSPLLSAPITNTHPAKSRSKTPHKFSRPIAASSPLHVPSSVSEFVQKPVVSLPSSSLTSSALDGDSKKKRSFFDPKRIFDQSVERKIPNAKSNADIPASCKQREDSTSTTHPLSQSKPAAPVIEGHIPNNQNHGTGCKDKGNLLNNGKAKSNLYMGNIVHPTKPGTTHYINNDLRQPTKETNTEGRNSPNRSANNATETEDSPVQSPESVRKETQIDVPPVSAPASASRRKQEPRKVLSEPRPHHYKRSRRHRETTTSHSFELLVPVWLWLKWVCTELMQLAQSIFFLILKIALALLAIAITGILTVICHCWRWIRVRFPKRKPAPVDSEEKESFDWSNPSSQSRFKAFGLEKNIILPTTGEEAMKRLLACKGKDPYSILGVRVDSPDEEIKKYYRKQAMLVHPDKNKIPGAEEAFKILGHSFDIIGEPDKRSQYDAQRYETQETENAKHEFADLLTELQSKMQEAVNLMWCDKCGARHRRVPIDRPWYNARFCDRCNVRHSAKEGDVWAESRMMGFLWHYYACMEGKIYDITEWASCQSGNFKHIQANAHHVIYRIATQAGARQRSQNSGARGRTSDAPDIEDFINQLFQRPGFADGMSPESPPPQQQQQQQQQQPQQQQQHPSGSSASFTSTATSTATSANANKKRGRKKKKH